MIKVVAVKDESSHWYVIPKDKLGTFQNYMNSLENDWNPELEDSFIEQFSEYMTGGDLNNIQLYADIK